MTKVTFPDSKLNGSGKSDRYGIKDAASGPLSMADVHDAAPVTESSRPLSDKDMEAIAAIEWAVIQVGRELRRMYRGEERLTAAMVRRLARLDIQLEDVERQLDTFRSKARKHRPPR